MSELIEKSELPTPNKNTTVSLKTKIFVITAAVIAALVLIAGVVMAMVPDDKIASGVYVDNLNLGGLTENEAIEVINKHLFYNNSQPSFTISMEDKESKILFSDVDLVVDSEAIAKSAFGICKTDNKISDAFSYLGLKFKKMQLPIVHKVNTLKLDTKLVALGEDVYGQLKQHDVQVLDDYILITPGSSGCSANFETVRNEILNELSKKQLNIPIKSQLEKPRDLDVETLYSMVNSEPRNATYEIENGRVKINPHVTGIEVDKDVLAKELGSVKEGAQPVKIPIKHKLPDITTSELKAKLFNTTLSTYTTKYNASAVNRSYNVALASSKINGSVFGVGDVFSYNDVVGPRTVARGFKNAPVYENGKSVDGIGGGICQVSTTLYSAVLYADLKVVSRTNHSLPVSYVPLGQDATVVDGAIDFKFKNDTDYPIKIVSNANNGVLTISILGTKRETDRTVKVEHTTVSTIAPTVKEIKTDTLPAGTSKITEKGKNGYVISSTKSVYENGVLVKSESLGKSTYKMTPQEVSVGTGAASASVTEAPKATQALAPEGTTNNQVAATPTIAPTAMPVITAEPQIIDSPV